MFLWDAFCVFGSAESYAQVPFPGDTSNPPQVVRFPINGTCDDIKDHYCEPNCDALDSGTADCLPCCQVEWLRCKSERTGETYPELIAAAEHNCGTKCNEVRNSAWNKWWYDVWGPTSQSANPFSEQSPITDNVQNCLAVSHANCIATDDLTFPVSEANACLEDSCDQIAEKASANQAAICGADDAIQTVQCQQSVEAAGEKARKNCSQILSLSQFRVPNKGFIPSQGRE